MKVPCRVSRKIITPKLFERSVYFILAKACHAAVFGIYQIQVVAAFLIKKVSGYQRSYWSR